MILLCFFYAIKNCTLVSSSQIFIFYCCCIDCYHRESGVWFFSPKSCLKSVLWCMPKYLHHVIIPILLIIIILLHSICDCWPCPSSPLQYVFCELHPLEIGSVKNFNHFTIWIVSCHYEEHKNCKQLQRHYLHIVSLILCTDEIFVCEHFEEVRHCCC